MSRYQTRKQKPISLSWLFLIPLTVIFALFVRGAHASFIKKQNADLEKEKYQQRLDKLEEKKTTLESKIDKLETDRGKEEEFRIRYDVAREGETIIRIIEK